MVDSPDTAAGEPSEAARRYAGLLLRLHELDPRGDTESAESSVVCEQMDAAWQSMSGIERRRMQGLSEDLYGLADHRAGARMSPDERKHWSETGKIAVAGGDDDAQLAHLRSPFPEHCPPELIEFLQGRCWQRLQYLDVALMFIHAAGKSIEMARLVELQLLTQLSRFSDARSAAEALLKDPTLPSWDTYVSAAMLYEFAATVA